MRARLAAAPSGLTATDRLPEEREVARRDPDLRPPTFASRETIAREFEVSVDTVDVWVRSGFMPPATFHQGGVKRWHWPTIEARLAGRPELTAQSDPWSEGLAYAQPKSRRRAVA